MITQKDLDALAATGLKAIVIDEKTDIAAALVDLVGVPPSHKRSDEGWFITFGFGSEWANHYYKLKAKDYDNARAEAFSLFGRNWAFMYPLADLPFQIKDYGLKERVHAPNDNEGSEE